MKSLKPPIHAITGHLSWALDGSVWATWRVDAAPFLHSSTDDKHRHHAACYTALAATPGEAIIESICAARDLDAFEAALSTTSDAELWRRHVEQTMETLADRMLYERTYWLTVKLDAGDVRTSIGALRSTLLAGLMKAPASPPTQADIAGRIRRANEIQLAWSAVGVTPATAAEVAWLYATKLRKGTGTEPVLQHDPGAEVTRTMLSSVFDVELLEGGDRDDADRGWNRNYLRVVTSQGAVAYQAHLALSRLPQRFVFPGGGEWLLAADQMWVPVDWHCRIRPVPNSRAQAAATRKLRQIVSNFAEVDGRVEGASPQLRDAEQMISEQLADLAANPSDPELEVAMWFTVAADNLEELEEQAEIVESTFSGDYATGRPTGSQLGLLTSTMAGSRPDRAVSHDYRQHAMPSTVAMAGMFGLSELGDAKGVLIGTHADSGLQSPVMLDPSYSIAELNASGSIAIIGEPGSGKGWLTKVLLFGAAYAGELVQVLDRNGEYERVAKVMTGLDVQIVRLGISDAPTLDPYAVVPLDFAPTVAAGILATLTGKGARTGPGGAMREACEKVATQRNPRMHLVLDELEAMGSDPDALEALGALRGFRKMGDLFDPTRPAARMNADFTVWRADLSLPTADEMAKEHLMQALPADKIESLARLYAITAAARSALLRDTRPATLAVADAHALMTTEGQALFVSTNLEGRKLNAKLILDSQSAGHFPDVVGEHMPIRFAGRTSTRSAAEKTLEFLGMEQSDAMIERLTTRPESPRGWPSGRFLHRDARGRTGLLQVVTPAVEELAEAFSTTPKGA